MAFNRIDIARLLSIADDGLIRIPPFTTALMEYPVVDDEYKKEIEKVRRDLRGLIWSKRCAPLLIRLAFNDAGTYRGDTLTGGPNGSIRMEEEYTQSCNEGLKLAIDYCEEIKLKHPLISYADIYQLAGVVAVEAMGGPDIDFVPGREDSEEWTEEGRLPDHSKGATPLRCLFWRLGLYDQALVAISGAYALVRAHKDISGTSDEAFKFDNSYFKGLMEKHSKGILDLPEDQALMDDALQEFVDKYAQDEELFFDNYALAHKKLSEVLYPRKIFPPLCAYPRKETPEVTEKSSNLFAQSAVGVAIAASIMVMWYRMKVRY